MKHWVYCVIGVVLLNAPVTAQNSNAWHPGTSIPNVHLTELYTHGGLPRDMVQGRALTILVNQGFAIGYSEDHNGPLYAVYRYGNLAEKAESLDERNYQRPPKFQVDLRTLSRVHHGDYTGSGFDRGHMAPNYGLRTQYGHLAQLETFFMSNILPQHKGLNQKRWADAEKAIVAFANEDMGTRAAGDDIKNLWVISGPIYEGIIETLPNSGIAIPTGFFKIVVRQKTYFDTSVQAIGVYYNHDYANSDFAEKFVTINWIEDKTGLDFHPNLADTLENRLESKRHDWQWQVLP